MRRLALTAALLGLAACSGGGGTGQVSGPPHVVSTTPSRNATVPASTTSVSVTYDRRMSRGWSFVQDGTHPFPFRTGEPTLSEDGLTITMPVRLQPNTSYTVLLNSSSFQNFRDAAGTPATPYTLTFSTGG